MLKYVIRAALASALLGLPSVAQAQAPAPTENCASANLMITPAPPYVDCRGAFSGNINGNISETNYLTSEFGGTWVWVGKSDDAGNGPFSAGVSGTSGTLMFDAPITGMFVLGIKAASNYSYYRYNAASAIASLPFQTIGTATNNQNVPQGISHAGLYVRQSQVVPEPSTYLLMAAGLAALGAVARKRRQA